MQPTTETISGGVLDLTFTETNNIVIAGEGAAADDLDTITGGVPGQEIYLIYGSETITLKHATGNLTIAGAADFIFNSANDHARAVKVGSDWVVDPVAIA